MKRVLCLLLLLCLVPIGAAAQEITISSDQRDYYVQQGAQASIPLVLTNTYGHEVRGTLERTVVSDSLTSAGAGPESAVQSAAFKIPDGVHSINLHLGPYDAPVTQKVTLRFEYTEGTDRVVTLDGLVVYVTENDPGQQNTKDPLISTDLPASQTPVQEVQQGQGEGQSLDQALQNGQMPGDTGALKNQLMQEANATARNRTSLEQVIENDPTIREILASLDAQGFSVDDKQVTPESNTTGQFLYHFKKKSGEEATLNGGMKDASFVFADQVSASPLSLPSLMQKNATYQAFADGLHGDGFDHVKTEINSTPNRTAVVLAWADRGQNPATAVATVINNTTLAGLTLHRPPPVPSTLIPMLLAFLRPIALTLLGVLCIVGGFVLYRRRRRDPDLAAEVQPPFDYVQAAEDLLVAAASFYAQGSPQRGYGAAGEALRLFLSYHYGDGTSSTDQEVIALLTRQGSDISEIQEILAQCSLVEFAKREPEAAEFGGILASVRVIIREAGRISGGVN
ncbi:hypothetical protein [Methanosphaerula subterraneus]|uniref:hypothetical protein n=1 Tax=Methanosphaerula subterraneus TaxID=3350244 RepID=UPI003F85B452